LRASTIYTNTVDIWSNKRRSTRKLNGGVASELDYCWWLIGCEREVLNDLVLETWLGGEEVDHVTYHCHARRVSD
jgi:hypothetical protein